MSLAGHERKLSWRGRVKVVSMACCAIPLAVLLLSGCGGGTEQAKARSSRPHIVLISIDTLRADRLGAWGYHVETSPFMDELARTGTRFASAWAPSPWTLPSHATLLTGLYPHRHGATRSELTIDAKATMLQEALQIDGYATCGIVTSLFVSAQYGFSRGFDYFHDFSAIEGEKTPGGADAEMAFDHALEWAAGHPNGQPTFLFLHLYDVHYPYAAPSPWDEKFDRTSTPSELEYENYFHYTTRPLTREQMAHQSAQYDEEVAYLDDAFRRFHEVWTASRPNTIFVVVSDHGEELGERGSWGHAHTLFSEQLHVPWLVAGPGVMPQVVEERVGLEDVAVTLATLSGTELVGTDGVDRGAQLSRGSPAGEDRVSAAFASTYRFQTIRHGWHQPPLSMLVDLREPEKASLFHQIQDHGQRRNLARTRRSDVDRLRKAMYAWRGQPWVAHVDGNVSTDGALVVDGQWKGRFTKVEAGAHLAVFPADAQLYFRYGEEELGPFSEAAGLIPAPEDSALGWYGDLLDMEETELTQEQKERLRSLGYLH